MKRAVCAALALALSACAAPLQVSEDYRYVPLTRFAHKGQNYRIFDKASASKLVVTPSLRAAMLQAASSADDRENIEQAVAAYLASGGRKCAVASTDASHDPQWEFTYTCEIQVTAYP